MGYKKTLLVLLVVSLYSSRGMTHTPSEVAHFQTPTYTSTENVPTSTPSGNVSAEQKILDELNQRILGLTNTVMRLDEINTRMMIRLDEMKNETLSQMNERLSEMDTQIMKHLNETDIRIKALEISATNSSEVNQNRTLLLSQAMINVIKQLDGIETRLQRQGPREGSSVDCCAEVSSYRKEKQFVLFTDEWKTWTEAYSDCTKRNMMLASIENEEENNKVVSLLLAEDRGKYFWLSGTDLGHTGRYVWNSTGRDVTYNQWYPGQPDHYVHSDGEVQHCMEIWRSGMRWRDERCSVPLPYICQHWV